jgi:hypothetical protein
MGLNGKNQHFYFDVCDTKFKTKLVETKKNLQNFLRFNSELSHLQEIIMREVSNFNVDARVHFYFYNPDDIIWSIAYMKSSCTYESLPMFNVIVDYSEGDILHIYNGYLVFSKRKTDLSGVINKYFHKDEYNYFMSKAIGGIALINADIMNSLGSILQCINWNTKLEYYLKKSKYVFQTSICRASVILLEKKGNLLMILSCFISVIL